MAICVFQVNRDSVIEVEVDPKKDEELYKILNEVSAYFWQIAFRLFFFLCEVIDSRQIMIYCSWMHRLVFSAVSILFLLFVEWFSFIYTRVSQTMLIDFAWVSRDGNIVTSEFSLNFRFQFSAIRSEIELIRNNIELMKGLINEQKFHYKDKSKFN